MPNEETPDEQYDDNDTDDQLATPGQIAVVLAELSRAYPFFSLDEQDGTVIDIKSTFAPGISSESNWLGWAFLIVRLAMIGWISGAGIAASIIAYGPGNARYWPLYFTSLTAL